MAHSHRELKNQLLPRRPDCQESKDIVTRVYRGLEGAKDVWLAMVLL